MRLEGGRSWVQGPWACGIVPAVTGPASPPPAAKRQSWLLATGFLALYLVTATRTVQGGDTAEFVTVAAQGGVAHPPGSVRPREKPVLGPHNKRNTTK